MFGLGSGIGGLLIGGAAVAAWLRARKREPRPAVSLLAWEKRLRGLTVAAVGLLAAGGLETAYGVFFVGLGLGLGIAVAGRLAGIPPALYWWSRRPLNNR